MICGGEANSKSEVGPAVRHALEVGSRVSNRKASEEFRLIFEPINQQPQLQGKLYGAALDPDYLKRVLSS